MLVATPNHVFARFPAHGHTVWNAVKAQRQAMWASFHEEAQGLRVGLHDAKARGDWQAVKEVFTLSLCPLIFLVFSSFETNILLVQS
jgi:hypothetical protein